MTKGVNSNDGFNNYFCSFNFVMVTTKKFLGHVYYCCDMVVKGYRCNEKGLPLSSVFNMDKKITRVYKNDIFELASTLIIFYVTLEGFNPEVFIGSLDIPAAILLFIVTFLFIIRTSEEKIFDARDVEG